MNSKRFAQPVSIFVGLGFPRDIETASEAFQVLIEWPGARSPTHTMALNVCRAAATGDVEAATARLAFEAFARARGVLAPEALAETAIRAADEWMAA